MFHFPSFTLDNFEGPLGLLLYLIQKEEIDPCGIVVKQLTIQLADFLDVNLDLGSEMLSLAASLLLLKSQKLLPSHEEPIEEIDENPRQLLIQNLIEYCRCKNFAEVLSQKEEEQRAYFSRNIPPFRKEWENKVPEIDLSLLKKFLEQSYKSIDLKHVIEGEEFHVIDQQNWLKKSLKNMSPISLAQVFLDKMSQQEWIVTFLALLELLKQQEIKILQEEKELYICLNH